MKSNSVDSLVTDPPAGIAFMGKAWDSDKGGPKQWIAWMESVMSEALRVLKPGAHALVWAIPRTSHWTATALENAGFEIRDVVTHVFGSGFPKSLDISKSIDKAAGESRNSEYKPNFKNKDYGKGMGGGEWNAPSEPPKTREAKAWQGFGTALKPASEHWILCRKPLSEKTVAKNVLKWGVGGLNIDASRVAIDPNDRNSRPNGSVPLSEGGKGSMFKMGGRNPECDGNTLNLNKGRFPANFVLSHSSHCNDSQCDFDCAVRMLDEQSGNRPSRGAYKNRKERYDVKGNTYQYGGSVENTYANEQGGASRFFYCAKASKSERNAGCETFSPKGDLEREDRIGVNQNTSLGKRLHMTTAKQNHHPTVKPQKLMTYLIRMVTPPGGIVLDPFTGSGSTGVAALRSGFKFVGIEREKEYVKIAKARLEAACV